MGQAHAPAVIGESQDFEPGRGSFGFDADASGAGIAAVLGKFAQKKPGIIAIGGGNRFGQIAKILTQHGQEA